MHFELFDRQIDLVQDNIDLDIRINDEIPDYYIAHLLTKNKRILCAAPAYLQKYPQPQSLQELSRHDGLVTKERDMTHGIWELGNGQEKKSVKVSGHLSSNSGEIVLQWALEGKGIMLRSEWDVLPFLESGKLVQVLPEYAQSANIWAVYRDKRILCAAPEYLQKYPQPQSLQELSRHDCLVTKERDMTHGIWELGNGLEKKSVKVSGHLSSNSGEIVLQWALEGKGIMLRSEWDVLPFL